jgi:hypothetical protein
VDPGIQQHLRAPTEQELMHVARVRARWHAGHGGDPAELLGVVVVAVGAMIVGAAIGHVPVLVIGGVMSLAVIVLYGLALRRGRRQRAARRGPWDLPDGWRVRETTICGRAVISAGSDDEDYASWLLFELEGAEWYALEPSAVSDDPTGASLARERLVIASIEPEGPVLSASASGEPLPRRGGRIDVEGADRIAAAGDAYADLVGAGFVWCPDRALPLTGGLVDADALPPWMRD